jgi:hypothetical protein
MADTQLSAAEVIRNTLAVLDHDEGISGVDSLDSATR